MVWKTLIRISSSDRMLSRQVSRAFGNGEIVDHQYIAQRVWEVEDWTSPRVKIIDRYVTGRAKLDVIARNPPCVSRGPGAPPTIYKVILRISTTDSIDGADLDRIFGDGEEIRLEQVFDRLRKPGSTYQAKFQLVKYYTSGQLRVKIVNKDASYKERCRVQQVRQRDREELGIKERLARKRRMRQARERIEKRARERAARLAGNRYVAIATADNRVTHSQ